MCDQRKANLLRGVGFLEGFFGVRPIQVWRWCQIFLAFVWVVKMGVSGGGGWRQRHSHPHSDPPIFLVWWAGQGSLRSMHSEGKSIFLAQELGGHGYLWCLCVWQGSVGRTPMR